MTVDVTSVNATSGSSARVAEFMDHVMAKNPGEVEFHQAVREVAESVMPFIDAHPAYRQARILERLVEPERVLMFRVPWLDDRGEIQLNRGFRIQMSSAIGPYKGGLRFHPTVTLGVLKFLAFEQVFKNSLTTLPMGGGKGGSDFDPKGKSDNEVMRFCQSFMTELYRHIGPDTDVPAGDIGVGGREIGYLFGQYKRIVNRFCGVLTGKGLEYGGSLLRPEATGYGCVYFAQEMLSSRGDSVAGKTALVSGSGNVAQYTVEKLNELGAKPITLSDFDGTIVDPDGIGPEKLAWVMQLKNVRRGRIREYAEHFKGATYLPKQRPWGVSGQLAFPSATQNEIDARGCSYAGQERLPAGGRGSQHADRSGRGRRVPAGQYPVRSRQGGQRGRRGDLRPGNGPERRHDPLDARRSRSAPAADHARHPCQLRALWRRRYRDELRAGANIGGFVKVADAMLAQGLV